MKKLLVILLLFFPVHGAWAEALKLRCTPLPKGSGNSVLHFITDHVVIGAGGKITGVKLSKTNYKIYWSSSKYVKEEMKKLFPNYKYSETTLDRVTGEMKVTHKYTNTTNFASYQCEKMSGKKKF